MKLGVCRLDDGNDDDVRCQAMLPAHFFVTLIQQVSDYPEGNFLDFSTRESRWNVLRTVLPGSSKEFRQ